MSDFEIVKTSTGATSIRDNRVNEIMHNPVGPWVEANALYVAQPRLRERLQETKAADLVVFDIGLGAASNAIAAMTAALQLNAPTRRLHLISFENNLSLLKFALLHAASFEHMKGFEPAIESILANQIWKSECGRIVWELRTGDFLERIVEETGIPEVIFFDPYSPNVNSEMWTLDCFKKLRAHCHPAKAEMASTLYTYSRSTPVRVGMLLAGFYVGGGESTGLKDETTQASTHMEQLTNPLDDRWLSRWQRSHTPLPVKANKEDRDALCLGIQNHPQFQMGEKK